MSFKAGAITAEAILDTGKWDNGLKKLSKGTAGFVKLAAGAFVAGMTASIIAANEFQKSMANVSTVVDTSAVSTQDMTKALFALDPALGSTTELTDGLYNAFSAGAVDMDEAIQITTDSAKFATAALTDNATAVDVLTTASNAYGKDIVTTAQASDIFFTTIKQGKITGEQLAGSIGQSIPLFASMGIELEQLAGGMATMTKQGISANESTTQLNGIVNSFLKPSEEMTAALNSIGVESGAAFLETEGLTGALDFLEDATGGNKDELAKLLPNISALKGAMALTGTGGKEYTKVLLEMEKATGATDVAFDKQEKTFETLQNQMGKISIIVGNIGKSFVDELAVGATEAAGSVVTFLTSTDGMILIGNVIGAVAGTFALLKEQLVPVVDLVKDVFIDVVNEAKNELQDLGVISGSGAGAFELLGFAVAGVTTIIRVSGVAVVQTISVFGDLVEAIVASGKTVSKFFDFMTGKAKWSEVKESASDAGDAFKNFGKGVVSSFTTIGATIAEETATFTERAAFSATQMNETFTLNFAATKDSVIENYGEMITGQEAMVETTLENQEELTEGIVEENDIVVDNTKVAMDSVKTVYEDHFKDAKLSWKGMYDTITSTIGAGLSTAASLSDSFFTAAEQALQLSTQAELGILEAQYAAGAISKEAFEAEKLKIEEDALVEQNKIAEKQFKTKQALDIAGAWMDAAAATMGWWAQAPTLGVVAGPIFAGAMTALTVGAAVGQTANIANQQFVPAREHGGMAGGLTRVNEAGGEIISLPDGSQVIPNDISRQIAQGSGSSGNIVNVNFYDTVVSSDVDVEEMAQEISGILGKELEIA